MAMDESHRPATPPPPEAIVEEDGPKLALSTSKGIFQWKVMPASRITPNTRGDLL